MVQSNQQNEIESFVRNLSDTIRLEANSRETSLNNAFPRVFAEYLSSEGDDENFLDGNDSGIDFFYGSDGAYEIFQFKMKNTNEDGEIEWDYNSPPKGIEDVDKSYEFLFGNLETENTPQILLRLKAEIGEYLDQEDEESEELSITFNLVTISNGTQPSTEQKIRNFTEKINLKNNEKENLNIQFKNWDISDIYNLYKEQVIDSQNFLVDKIKFKVLKSQPFSIERGGSLIRTEKFISLYVNAIDLVNAYRRDGFKLFDSNVRYNLKRSKINSKIKASATKEKSIKNFHMLNNGITIIADGVSYEGPDNNPDKVVLRNPNIINGCQTVVSLSDAYSLISSTRAQDTFEASCIVFAKILIKPTLGFPINQIVISSNSQNVMSERNLLSNNPEQKSFERSFAEQGWLYERKDGAVDALRADKKTSIGINIRQFRVGNTNRKLRSASNTDIASHWLNFIGFPREAQNRKKDFFKQNENHALYDYIFKSSPKFHGYDKYSSQDQDTYAITDNNFWESNSSPRATWMLYSTLFFRVVKHLLPSIKGVRLLAKNELNENSSSEDVTKHINESQALSLKYGSAMADHLIASLSSYSLKLLLNQNWLSGSSVSIILNAGIIKKMNETDEINLIKESIDDLTFEDIKNDPALISIKIAHSVFERTLKEELATWVNSERKTRLFQNKPFELLSLPKIERYVNDSQRRLDCDYWEPAESPKNYFQELINNI